ncbi:glutamine amidotransferase [Enterococcus sp. JM4C]|uniref:type 1 glutamine amidotransferase family protein n=1 Tax=Candidatus Enterococcus huntleyi TaxID=1857217 RepID=UPI00137B1709|nr:type 1 glutamine amidotransferase family protein [Enterococcus sp. JM4C]KAF1295548.1 glutamine amidotransferase [Enterococcus sp. JM4C]
MLTIYIYAMGTLADWEIGNVMAELHSKRFFKKTAPDVTIKMVSHSTAPIQTMGGLTIIPDCLVEEIIADQQSLLILPGSDTWSNPEHFPILEKAREFLSLNLPVAAICGATVALANVGLLNDRPHTSNGPGFLEMVCPTYIGQNFYVDEPAVTDKSLITASSTGALLWTKQIIQQLDVFAPETLTHWYNYFSTGDSAHYFALAQSLSSED